MEHKLNDSDRGKPKYSGQKLAQLHGKKLYPLARAENYAWHRAPLVLNWKDTGSPNVCDWILYSRVQYNVLCLKRATMAMWCYLCVSNIVLTNIQLISPTTATHLPRNIIFLIVSVINLFHKSPGTTTELHKVQQVVTDPGALLRTHWYHNPSALSWTMAVMQ
jgi:hypothetical protein